jgi:hypothetical protein
VDHGYSGEARSNAVFTTPSGHPGVAFVAASGDNGVFGYPSGSPNVLGVGGTTLTLNADNSIAGERSWAGSGGGLDPYEATPAYQSGLSLGHRGTPDVAYNATNYAVYDSTYRVGWESFHGTSAGAPQWAALLALADQRRARIGLAPLDGRKEVLPRLYALALPNFLTPSGGNDQADSAARSYTPATGLGSPAADRLVPALAAPHATRRPYTAHRRHRAPTPTVL